MLLGDIERICRQGLDSRTLRARIMSRLGRDVAYDAFCFGTIDPWTLLVTDDVSEGIPPGSAGLAAHNEYLVPDVDKFADLARTGRAVGILSRSTGGELDASARFRTVLPIIEAQHELRAVFLAAGECWGGLSMFRRPDRPDFTPAEAALVRALSRPVAVALRRACAHVVPRSSALPDPVSPGVLVLDGGGRTLYVSESAQHWLAEIGTLAPYEVAAAARAGRGEEAYLRVRSRPGRWLSLWGSPLAGSPPGNTSVVIQPAPQSDLMAMLTAVHGLSTREREILEQVIAGRSSTGIAASLTLSPLTVQDHLKSIFVKFGVNTRGQLVARALGVEHPVT
ncbi:MAG: helix-turn-helix transcriptional regulator [Actinoplanes sp.]